MARVSPRFHESPAYVACHSDRSRTAPNTVTGRTHPPVQITSSGLDKQIAAAKDRLQKKLDKAHELFAPLGLTREELESAVLHILRKETSK
jgi:hypothetical protein